VAVAMQVTGIARAEDMKIMTGPLNTTQQRIAGEFASQVAPAANITLEVVPTAGPTDSLQRLRDESKHSADVSLAVLQADVANLYLLAAGRGNADAARWLAPLRVVAPLYSEELHFVVRSDSGFNTVQDIRDARINIGPSNGGTALSVVMLYRLLFEAPIAGDKLSRLSHEEALIKLLTDRSVDVVALLADQPAPLLANMKPEARRFIKLLKFDATQPGSASALDVYHPAALRQTSYPNLLAEDVPTLAVQLYLVAHDVQHDGNGTRMARLANAYCQALPLLKTKGLAKWREVDAGLPNLAPGWHYDKAAAFELILCSGGGKSEIPDVCLPQERALSLCN
jgi:TRAP-type uncharacterized transport system substrate-binding protein